MTLKGETERDLLWRTYRKHFFSMVLPTVVMPILVDASQDRVGQMLADEYFDGETWAGSPFVIFALRDEVPDLLRGHTPGRQSAIADAIEGGGDGVVVIGFGGANFRELTSAPVGIGGCT